LLCEKRGNAFDVFRLALAGVLLVCVPMAPFMVKDDIIYNGYINTLFFGYFLILPLTFYFEPGTGTDLECSEASPGGVKPSLSTNEE